MDSQGSETTKAEILGFSGDVYLVLKVCQSPFKFDFKLKMAHIEFFNQILWKYKQKNNNKYGKKWPNFRENDEIWNFCQQIHITLRKSRLFIILGHFCHFQPIKIKSPYIYNTLRNKIYGFARLQDDKSWDLKIYRRCLSWPKGVPITIEI